MSPLKKTNEIDFAKLEQEWWNEGIPDPREAILKSGHYVTYGDDENDDVRYIEFPDLMRVTIPATYLPEDEEFESRQFSAAIKVERLTRPCYENE